MSQERKSSPETSREMTAEERARLEAFVERLGGLPVRQAGLQRAREALEALAQLREAA